MIHKNPYFQYLLKYWKILNPVATVSGTRSTASGAQSSPGVLSPYCSLSSHPHPVPGPSDSMGHMSLYPGPWQFSKCTNKISNAFRATELSLEKNHSQKEEVVKRAVLLSTWKTFITINMNADKQNVLHCRHLTTWKNVERNPRQDGEFRLETPQIYFQF